ALPRLGKTRDDEHDRGRLEARAIIRRLHSARGRRTAVRVTQSSPRLLLTAFRLARVLSARSAAGNNQPGATMLLIREIMYCKPGKVRPMVEKFLAMSKLGEKSGMPRMRVMTDFSAERY